MNIDKLTRLQHDIDTTTLCLSVCLSVCLSESLSVCVSDTASSGAVCGLAAWYSRGRDGWLVEFNGTFTTNSPDRAINTIKVC